MNLVNIIPVSLQNGSQTPIGAELVLARSRRHASVLNVGSRGFPCQVVFDEPRGERNLYEIVLPCGRRATLNIHLGRITDVSTTQTIHEWTDPEILKEARERVERRRNDISKEEIQLPIACRNKPHLIGFKVQSLGSVKLIVGENYTMRMPTFSSKNGEPSIPFARGGIILFMFEIGGTMRDWIENGVFIESI